MFSSLLVILVATTSTLGIGDFLCSNQTIPGQIDPNVRSCQSWANNSDGLAQGNISPSAICQPGELSIFLNIFPSPSVIPRAMT
jgi:hypothetical protein